MGIFSLTFDPVVLAVSVLVIMFLVIISVAGPGGYLIGLTLVKSGFAYVWKLAYPVWIVLKQKGPYKAGAVGLVFINFWLQLYSFAQSKSSHGLEIAFDALAATLVGGFSQVTNAGYVMLQGPTILTFIKAVIIMVLGFSSIIVWYMGWRLAKNRVPELTYYILVTVLAITLAWGLGELGTIFEVFNLVETAAETTTGNATITQNASLNSSIASELPF